MGDDSDAQDGGAPPMKKQKVEVGETSQCAPKDTQEASQEATAANFAASDDMYDDFATPEEVEKLREFRVLDEIKSNDEDSNDCYDSDSSMGESVEVPEEEVEKMLDENLPEGFKAAPKPKEKPYVIREKVVLQEKGVNHFEVLPLDWIMIRHQSGMPVYVHRATRVCCVSRPYFLGKGNAKRHDIPISAIPCLAYRRALEEEERENKIDAKVDEQIKLGTWILNNQGNPNANQKDVTENSAENNIDENAKDETKESSNGAINIEALQSKCPFKRGLITNSDMKTCPVSNVDANGCNGNANECQVSDNKSNETLTINNQKKNESVARILNDEGLEDISSENSQDLKDLTEESPLPETNDLTGNDINKKSNDVNKNDTSVKPGTSADKDVVIPPNRQPIVLPGGIVVPAPRVETVNTSWKTKHLTGEQVNEYCQALFQFKTVKVMHFKRWADRRKYIKARKALQCPTLPEGTKLITIPAQNNGPDNAGMLNRDWVLNMNGRSYLSVFHEYVRRALQKQPVYEFKQLENASTPYQATVYIGGMQYGVGHGSSKRLAKSIAARDSIGILVPEIREFLQAGKEMDPDFVFFDYVGIEDPRIAEFCAATCEPTPHAILRTCLLRNFGAGDRHIHTEVSPALHWPRGDVRAHAARHPAHVPAAQLRRRRPTHTHRGEPRLALAPRRRASPRRTPSCARACCATSAPATDTYTPR
ncbi:microprocessor complex subunit DGCR8 isoform X1 [Epargyreus clarus]|uniref:microprocessor complex subunit DGCR8 isoform X1 n=1 Tax=Epargyreus clarus TaxID=520877 RepID=UPI003C3030AB